MANRRQNPYARAYSFGTDGSAALAGSPIASHRMIASPPKSTLAARGVLLPRWLILVVAGILAIAALWMIGDVLKLQEDVRTDITRGRYEVALAQQRIKEIDEQLAIASDETRVRSIAVNRLGMQQPTAEQLFALPSMRVADQSPQLPQQYAPENISFFRLLLNLIGL